MQTTPPSINEPDNSSTTTAARPRFTPEARRAILERFHASGLKQKEFIAGEGISKATLGKWLQRERRQAKTRLPKPRFQEVLVKPAGANWQVEIVSPQNWTVRLAAAPAVLAEVLGSLPC